MGTNGRRCKPFEVYVKELGHSFIISVVNRRGMQEDINASLDENDNIE